MLHAIDVANTCERYKFKNIPCYVYTLSGLLKILESFVARVIFAFLSNTSLYLHQPALEWCVAVYSICFVQVAVAMLLGLGGWENRLPLPLPIFHLGLTMLSVLLYVRALVLWPLYQFDEKLGGRPYWCGDMSCFDELTDCGCVWDQRLAVAVLTAVNLLAYAADLGYWAHQVSVGTEDQHSAPDPLHSQEVSLQSSAVSPDALFLAPSLPLHILPIHLAHFPVSFPPSALSPSCFPWLPISCFASLSCFSHRFYIFCFLPLFWSSLVFSSPVS